MATDLSPTAQAYQRLRDDILACRLRLGEKLKISGTCATLGFSFGAVREALSRLTSEGLVKAERNEGYRVTPMHSSHAMRTPPPRRYEITCHWRCASCSRRTWPAKPPR